MDPKQFKELKDAIRAIKDLAEATKHKVDSQQLFLHSTSENVRSIKEQQSIMNEKLDEMGESLDANTGSVIAIERTIKTYGDMYKMNNDNIVKLAKRINILEEEQGINPPEELLLGKVR
jgi:chromosome segregation ATPase